MDFSDYLAALRREGELLVDNAERAGLDAPVPTCPEWRVHDLLRHIGKVHRWAAGNVARGGERVTTAEAQAFADSAPDGDPVFDWYREGHAELLRTLAETLPGWQCWSFMPTSDPLGWWARRQCHETAIHRADAAFACDVPVLEPYPAEMAADGVDEVLTVMLPRRQIRAKQSGETLTERERSLGLHATDTGGRWHLRVTPNELAVSTDADADEAAECTAHGPAEQLYLLLWNRAGTGDLKVSGDDEVLDWWREGVRI